jgi:multidrug resistance efflux pump
MTNLSITEANAAFSKQISGQVAKITQELNRLEHLLSAGMVDRRVLVEFRDAVNKVRNTSWHVQCWLDGDVRELSSLLLEERVRATSQLATLLAADLQNATTSIPGMVALKDSMRKLELAMDTVPATT